MEQTVFKKMAMQMGHALCYCVKMWKFIIEISVLFSSIHHKWHFSIKTLFSVTKHLLMSGFIYDGASGELLISVIAMFCSIICISGIKTKL